MTLITTPLYSIRITNGDTLETERNSSQLTFHFPDFPYHTHGHRAYVRRLRLFDFGKTWIFNDYALTSLRDNINIIYREPGCSFQTLEGRLPIGDCPALLNAITSTF